MYVVPPCCCERPLATCTTMKLQLMHVTWTQSKQNDGSSYKNLFLRQ